MERFTVFTLRDAAAWQAQADSFVARDLGHYPRFARVYEEKGDGCAECVLYESALGRVLYPYIRRPIDRLPFSAHDFRSHTDIWTPYCYGGYIHDAPKARAAELVALFRGAFERYAVETKIVSEFVRFHPMLQNQEHSSGFFDRLALHRDNVLVDLSLDEASLLGQCRQSYRHCIKKARGAGLTLHVEDPQGACNSFAELYQQTMARHGQTGYLNLDARYFELLFRELANDMELISVRHGPRTITTAIFLKHGACLDYFLCGSDADAFAVHPNHFLLFEVALWAKSRGYRWLHLGGGRDSLYFFKRGFSERSAPFYIGAKVHLPDAYAVLRELRKSADPPLTPETQDFFPAHRAGYE